MSKSVIFRLGGLTCLYIFVAKLRWFFAVPLDHAPDVWLISGAAIAALTLSERKLWSAILAGVFFVNWLANGLAGHSLVPSFGFAAVNTLTTIGGASLMRYWDGGRITLRRVVDIRNLLGVIVLVNALGAVGGALIGVLAYNLPFDQTWLAWWNASAVSLLIFSPFIIFWFSAPIRFKRIPLKQIGEVGIWFGFATLGAWFVFSGTGANLILEPRPYILFPLLVWAALRFNQRTLSAALVWIAIVATFNTLDNPLQAPLGGSSLTARLTSLNMFLIVSVGTTLILAALVIELNTAFKNIGESEGKLRALFEILPIGISILDADHRITYMNPGLERIVGLSEPALRAGAYQSRRYLRADGSEMPQTEFASARALYEKRIVHNVETGIMKENGEVVWTQVSAIPVSLSDWRAVVVTVDITERKRAEAQLIYLGTHDILTGVYNRTFFETELTRLDHPREFPVSLVVIDLDNLKQTNDTHGHSAGDEMLQNAARILQTTFRTSDIIARIGGDEFAVILPKTDTLTATHILARLRENLNQFNAHTSKYPVGLSLGVATLVEGHLVDAFKIADARMYAEKRAHKEAAMVG